MPTYDYTCTACGHNWELFQSMSAKPVQPCPACKKKTAKRLIGIGAAVLFKGGGFYETDYRSESYKKAAEADKKSAEPAPKPDTTPKADAKPDAKADAKQTSKPETTKAEPPKAEKPAKPEPGPAPSRTAKKKR